MGSPYLDQIDAQRGLLAAELSVIRARVDHLNAFVTLYQTMGGGWASSYLARSDRAVPDTTPGRLTAR
jgi:outer membrane protein, multidrug efflux system